MHIAINSTSDSLLLLVEQHVSDVQDETRQIEAFQEHIAEASKRVRTLPFGYVFF